MQSARWYDIKLSCLEVKQLIHQIHEIEKMDRMINLLPGYKDMLKQFTTCTFIFEYISLKDAHV